VPGEQRAPLVLVQVHFVSSFQLFDGFPGISPQLIEQVTARRRAGTQLCPTPHG
jgi:hypothetical protein